MDNDSNALVALEAACTSLSTCCDLTWVQEIRERSRAMETLGRVRKIGLEAQNRLAAMRLEADRRFGQLTKELKASGHQRSKPGRPKKRPSSTLSAEPVTAADLGVDRKEVQRAEQLAAVPEETFRLYIETATANGEEITAAAARKLAPTKPKKTAGKPVFDYKKWEAKTGELIRLTDDHHRAYPDRAMRDSCLESLNTYLADMKAWKKKVHA